jgi:hypothetical protein
MQTPLIVDTDSEPTPKGASEAQLIKSVPCLLLRVSKKGIITVSNDPDAARTGVSGKYDRSRSLTVLAFLSSYSHIRECLPHTGAIQSFSDKASNRRSKWHHLFCTKHWLGWHISLGYFFGQEHTSKVLCELSGSSNKPPQARSVASDYF